MEIYSVCLEITTHCDQRCPDCCVGVGINRDLHHHDWAYFERAAEHLRGIERVHVTGGEPTAHPQFTEFVPRFRELFACKTLTLESNGLRLVKYAELIAKTFDWVNYTDYHVDRNGCLAVLQSLGVRVNYIDGGLRAANFVPRIRRAAGAPCTRAWFRSGGFGYADEKMFGCSVGPGIPGAESLVPCVGWREKMASVKMPCADCWFAE